MPRRISFTEATGLVRSRDELRGSGFTERELRDLVGGGALKRIHRGFYVTDGDWRDLWPEGRQLLRVLAVRRASPGAGPVFTHASAAVLWDLPLYRVRTDRVHTLILGRRHTRTSPGVARHDIEVSCAHIVERHGLRCTSLARTVFDMARTARPEVAVSVGDASLRQVSFSGGRTDADSEALWREQLGRLAVPGLRGVRQARWLADFADGRAQLPGESVSRLQLFRLGYRDVDLQVPVVGAAGDRYFLDFGFRRARAFGEFDGEAKYLNPLLRSGSAPTDVVLAEKRREDDIRGVTGWRFARWGHAHIRDAETLGVRLSACGILPP